MKHPAGSCTLTNTYVRLRPRGLAARHRTGSQHLDCQLSTNLGLNNRGLIKELEQARNSSLELVRHERQHPT